jgi:hypothetical protein
VKDRCEDEIQLKRPTHRAAGRPKKAEAPTPTPVPRITRLMALAIKFQDMIDRGEVKDYAELARLGYVTRARVTQIMNLTLLAPDIQEKILLGFVDEPILMHRGEAELRRVISFMFWPHQRARWAGRR